MASRLEWIPDSLYNSAVTTLVNNYPIFQSDLRYLPESITFDLLYQLYKQNKLCFLSCELFDLDVFAKITKVKDKRHLLHHCFQAVMDHGTNTASSLARSYKQRCEAATPNTSAHRSSFEYLISVGISIGNFLSDAGWFLESEQVLLNCLSLCRRIDDYKHWVSALECCLRLLHVQQSFCKFTEAMDTLEETKQYIVKLTNVGHSLNLAGLYSEFSSLYSSRSQYKEAYEWAMQALVHLNSNAHPKSIIDVLRQASKACVVKREFKQAELLIKQALHMAWEHFGREHPKTADTLLDYGFYLLNTDSVSQSVRVYRKVLDIRQSVHGGKNLHVALAHEDLAYSSYVLEYRSGRFQNARDHAEKAMQIMTHLLPENHLLLASSKRVKALILEEIAIDNTDKEQEMRLLQEALDLHVSALRLSCQAFGEMNVQTAKHYGNLGRLYQSMRRFKEAEEMHLKAIDIKERLLGPEDYEVALSVGHLASLYNYDMKLYEQAEHLYLRSIAIGTKLFGEAYSGLEYDYRGLLRVSMEMNKTNQVLRYTRVLEEWRQLRQRSLREGHDASPFTFCVCKVPPEDIYKYVTNLR
uniref:Putative kinesin light chain n=1 Tax=Hyalomma excavatum TaxID=257692 RepID=A0A131XIK6_9ACAR